MCHYQRAKNCRLFSAEASFGYCAAKDEKYYGFRGHLVISTNGVITGFSLTSANVSEREALWDVIHGISRLLIGDKGYLSSSLQQELLEQNLNLQTPKRSNLIDSRDRHWVQTLVKTRRLVETTGELRRASHGRVPSALIGQRELDEKIREKKG